MPEHEAEQRQEQRFCSFCRKRPNEVGPLVESPEVAAGVRAYICGECIELCQSILNIELERRKRTETSSPDSA
jgi:ATP-dependent Clp protease ATP-binding subunit ClpX